MAFDIHKMRNIGISAHIDSGKTTLSERILFYCNKIHAIHEVKGKDGAGATMDSMDLERERGITIQSAATNVQWKDYDINLIDTPGHVDFTIEVERSLRVLDGAVLVLCAVAGVQSQSITVDRQLKRYHVPRIAFINKCDRTGANPFKVKAQLTEKLGLNPVFLTLPIGLEDKLEGIIDLIEMKAVYFDGDAGTDIRYAEIPQHLQADAEKYREELIDSASMFSDELAEAYLDGNVTNDQIIAAVRAGTVAEQLVPVFVGSAYKNKGVQVLLDGVAAYLPDPTEVRNIALDLDKDEEERVLTADGEAPTVALAFKLDDGQYGQLTYVRIYQGSLKKGDELLNTRARKRFKVGRLVRMHAATMEDITEGTPGDIVALFGIECASGDTFCSPSLNYAMTSMYVPEPVISLSVTPKDKKSSDQLGKALKPLHQGRPHLPDLCRPRVQPDHHQGHGRAPPRGLHRAHEARVPLRGRDGHAPGRLPRGHHPEGRLLLYPQEADGRFRPVRKGRRLHRALRGQELRLRGHDQGRRDPQRVHPLLREGLQGRHPEGHPHRLPHREHPMRDQRRRLPPRRLLGHSLPAGRHRGPSGSPTRRPSPSSSSPS